MTLAGPAFVIMWHDIAADADAEYNQWHTRQHMPERIEHPGFLRSRRGVNRALDRQVYFTLYEGDGLAAFESPEYFASLNGPTEWTQKVAPSFRNFLRAACTVRSTMGQGLGGALTTLRCTFGEGGEPATDDAVAALSAIPAVTAVHVAVPATELSRRETTETALRPQMQEPPFDLVIVIEGIGLAELTAAEGAMRQAVAPAGFADVLVQSYDVAFILAEPGL